MTTPVLLHLFHEKEMEFLGQVLAKALGEMSEQIQEQGLIIRLNGDLGAGKTTLTRAILRGLGYQKRVKSPTFSLLEIYKLKDFTLNHFDYYRFESPEEFEDAGFRENFGPGQVTISEWTSKAEPYVPEADIQIVITQGDEEEKREVKISANNEVGQKLLAKVNNDWNK